MTKNVRSTEPDVCCVSFPAAAAMHARLQLSGLRLRRYAKLLLVNHIRLVYEQSRILSEATACSC
jgi:hypothetical protein